LHANADSTNGVEFHPTKKALSEKALSNSARNGRASTTVPARIRHRILSSR
jgi:hypothetical protein